MLFAAEVIEFLPVNFGRCESFGVPACSLLQPKFEIFYSSHSFAQNQPFYCAARSSLWRKYLLYNLILSQPLPQPRVSRGMLFDRWTMTFELFELCSMTRLVFWYPIEISCVEFWWMMMVVVLYC